MEFIFLITVFSIIIIVNIGDSKKAIQKELDDIKEKQQEILTRIDD